MPSKLTPQTQPLPNNQSPNPIDVGEALDRLFWELGQINHLIAQLEGSFPMRRRDPAACRERTPS